MNDKDQSPKSKDRKASSKKKTDKQKPDGKKYDLEERTAVFGERIIDFVKTLPINVINRELIRQKVDQKLWEAGENYFVRKERVTPELVTCSPRSEDTVELLLVLYPGAMLFR